MGTSAPTEGVVTARRADNIRPCGEERNLPGGRGGEAQLRRKFLLPPAPTRTGFFTAHGAGGRKGRPYKRVVSRTGGRIISAPAAKSVTRQAGAEVRFRTHVPGGRGGEAQLRRKFFAKLSFKKARGRPQGPPLQRSGRRQRFRRGRSGTRPYGKGIRFRRQTEPPREGWKLGAIVLVGAGGHSINTERQHPQGVRRIRKAAKPPTAAQRAAPGYGILGFSRAGWILPVFLMVAPVK